MLRGPVLVIGHVLTVTLSNYFRKWWADYKTPALITRAPFPFPLLVLFSLPLPLPFLRLPHRLQDCRVLYLSLNTATFPVVLGPLHKSQRFKTDKIVHCSTFLGSFVCKVPKRVPCQKEYDA